MRQAAELIRSKTALRPELGVVLGSGLGSFADSLVDAVRIPYRNIPGLPAATAVGHAGELVLGTLGTVDLAVMSGRFHLYEGYSARDVAAGIRLFHELGIRRVVCTNAAGAINLAYSQGALVLISDHINLQGANPLVGPGDITSGPHFPDMTEAYSARLRQIAREAAADAGIVIHEGVYAGVLGPSYETPAEIRFLKTIGADLVGMSTVPEVITANHLGMDVLGISCVTNLAAGLSGRKLDHSEVLATGQRVSASFLAFLTELLPRLC